MRYFEELKRAVHLEREEEKRAAIDEIKNLSGEKRERIGRAVLNLKGTYVGRELGGLYAIKFGRSKPIDTEIEVGDVVLVSKGNPLKSDLTGTVISKTLRSLSVAFSNSPPRWTLSKGIRVDLFLNDTTFRRMEKAIEIMENSDRVSWVREVILGKTSPNFNEVHVEFSDKSLNEFQRLAVEKALGSRIFLIHGPPGTGKTRTLAEIIVQLVRSNKRVAVSADSNAAVDNILEILISRGVNAVRIGHPSRVEKNLINHTLSFIVQSLPGYSKVRFMLEEAQRMMMEREKFIKPEPKYRRGLSDEEIVNLSRSHKSIRGIPSRVISSMAKWIEVNGRISEILERSKELEMKLVKKVLSEAQVVTGTNASFGVEYMKDEMFDALVHDEATQSTEPSSYIPLVLSNSLIMAGDHKQLPPTVVSQEAFKILSETLFEKLIGRYKEMSETLRVQYRMNEKIMGFPSEKFYGGKLIADESVRRRTLETLGFKPTRSKFSRITDPSNSLILINTSFHTKRWESQKRGSTSRENRLEALIVKRVIDDLVTMGLESSLIGVITPYDDQVSLLRRMLPEGIKVSTVDAFQGKEREVIVISFVRSNKNGDIGFLEDMRRLNVSITRAKSKLIVIGDFSTLSVHPIYADLKRYVGENGYILNLNDINFPLTSQTL